MTGRELAQQLKKYLPPATEEIIAGWIIRYRVNFRVTMPRNSRYGDYRPPGKGKGHKITINGDLNRYAFLITVVHEFAHLEAFEKYGETVFPHGSEWKNEFRKLMNPFLNEITFPAELLSALITHMANPDASSCYDHNLTRALKKYDRYPVLFLEDIPEKSEFSFNGKKFVKGEKIRTRYKCRQSGTKQYFLIGKTAEVLPVNYEQTH